jgi:hypothetical protein
LQNLFKVNTLCNCLSLHYDFALPFFCNLLMAPTNLLLSGQQGLGFAGLYPHIRKILSFVEHKMPQMGRGSPTWLMALKIGAFQLRMLGGVEKINQKGKCAWQLREPKRMPNLPQPVLINKTTHQGIPYGMEMAVNTLVDRLHPRGRNAPPCNRRAQQHPQHNVDSMRNGDDHKKNLEHPHIGTSDDQRPFHNTEWENSWTMGALSTLLPTQKSTGPPCCLLLQKLKWMKLLSKDKSSNTFLFSVISQTPPTQLPAFQDWVHTEMCHRRRWLVKQVKPTGKNLFLIVF